MDDRMDPNEMISALADGRLQGEAFGRAVQAVCSDPAAQATWHAYHVIGDVLRSRELGAATPAQAFLDKLSARLANEQALPVVAMADLGTGRREAANDATFRWKLVAGLASLAAVTAVGWSVLATTAPAVPGAQPQLALAPQSVPASGSAPMTVMARSDSGVMIRDPKLDELLAAHRQLAGASALQMPAGFLRNATFEGPER